jgi:hypothetical protein
MVLLSVLVAGVLAIAAGQVEDTKDVKDGKEQIMQQGVGDVSYSKFLMPYAPSSQYARPEGKSGISSLKATVMDVGDAVRAKPGSRGSDRFNTPVDVGSFSGSKQEGDSFEIERPFMVQTDAKVAGPKRPSATEMPNKRAVVIGATTVTTLGVLVVPALLLGTLGVTFAFVKRASVAGWLGVSLWGGWTRRMMGKPSVFAASAQELAGPAEDQKHVLPFAV